MTSSSARGGKKPTNLEFITHQKYSPKRWNIFSDKCKLKGYITLDFIRDTKGSSSDWRKTTQIEDMNFRKKWRASGRVNMWEI